MRRLALLFLLAYSAQAVETHAAKGIVLQADATHKVLDVSCEQIPGYMDAMEMEFSVRDPKALAGLKPGAAVNFTIVKRGKQLLAEDIRAGTTANFESEPMSAGQLTELNNILGGSPTTLSIGQRVPDFSLTDQTGDAIRLTQFQGKVVAVTFGYSRCPNPNYCFRLSNNLEQVEQRFREKAGRDLVLMTIMIDPEHDQGTTLTQFANVFKADAADWHFLTGPLPEVKRIAATFGLNFWSNEGLVTHSLHTAIVDRRGKLAINLEGNQFTARQLGDLIQTVMNQP